MSSINSKFTNSKYGNCSMADISIHIKYQEARAPNFESKLLVKS